MGRIRPYNLPQNQPIVRWQPGCNNHLHKQEKARSQSGPVKEVPMKPIHLKWTAVLAAVALIGCSTPTPSADSAAAKPGDAPAPAAAAPPQPRRITLPEGAALKVRTTTAISTETHNTGDSFVATLHEPLVDGNRVVAPKGARVEGVVANADKGGRVQGVAVLSVRLTRMTLENGQAVDISTGSVGVRARTTKKSDATKVGIASGVGAAIGAIAGGGKGAAVGAAAGAGAGGGVVLATRGDPAVIAGESLLTFKLTAPVAVTVN
jgi:hypothetical protein